MSKLNKLLNMLEELKEENPELANKALLAAETLKAGTDPEDLEEDWEEEPEEEFDDSYIEVSTEDTKKFLELRNLMDQKVREFGTYMRDHEVAKLLRLEEIEEVRQGNEDLVSLLREQYRLDSTAQYSIQIDTEGGGNIVFVKE